MKSWRKKVNSIKVTINIVLRVEARKKACGTRKKRKHKRPRNTETPTSREPPIKVALLNAEKPASKKDDVKEKEKISLTLFHEWSFHTHTHTRKQMPRAKLSYESFFFYARFYVSLCLRLRCSFNRSSARYFFFHQLSVRSKKETWWTLEKVSLKKEERNWSKPPTLEKINSVEKLSRLMIALLMNHRRHGHEKSKVSNCFDYITPRMCICLLRRIF